MSKQQAGRQKAIEVQEFLEERFTSTQRAEAFFKRFDYDFLVKMRSTIDEVAAAKHKEFLQEQAELAKKAEAIEKIRALAAEHDIEIEGMSNGKKKKKGARKRNLDPEKYAVKYKDEPQPHFWTGFGHAPKPFKAAMEKGFKKEDMLNPKTGKYFEISSRKLKAAA